MYDVIQGNNALIIQEESNISNLYARFIAYTDVKDTTLKNYTSYIKQFILWIRENGISHPTREDIKAYKEHLKSLEYSNGTQQQYLRAVKHFFKWASSEGLYENIGDGIKTAKVRADNTKKEAFNVDDFHIILNSIDRSTEAGKRDYCILLLSVTGALRINEMRLANIGDLQTIRGEKVLYIQGKGHDAKDDYKKIPHEVEEAINDYLSVRPGAKKSDPLFTGTSNRAKGQRISVPGISRLIKNIFINAGYDSDKLTAHSLRHTSNTFLFKAGADLYRVQQHARHSNAQTTEIYLHAMERENDHSEQDIYNYIFKGDTHAELLDAIEKLKKLDEAKQREIIDLINASM